MGEGGGGVDGKNRLCLAVDGVIPMTCHPSHAKAHDSGSLMHLVVNLPFGLLAGNVTVTNVLPTENLPTMVTCQVVSAGGTL